MRAFIVGVLFSCFLVQAGAQDVSVTNPGGGVRFELTAPDGRLYFSVALQGKRVIEVSPLAMAVDGKNLSEGAAIGEVERYQTDEKYPWYGARSEALDRSNGARVNLTHKQSGTKYTLEIRAYDDGVAFRHIIPGEGTRVPDEATAFKLPNGSVTWTHDADDHYESFFTRQSLPAVAPGEWALPPLTVRLAKDTGYVSITEAALREYSGMGLQGDGQGVFKTRLGHSIPASYPFRLRYADLVERMSKAAAIAGTITPPWASGHCRSRPEHAG